jgi:hypothetical protein
LLARGRTNGVEGLRLLDRAELRRVEPNVAPDATGALFAPSAGVVIPFEFTIALAENAARNGVEFRCCRQVVAIAGGQGQGGGGGGGVGGGGGYAVRALHSPSPVALAQQRQRGAWTAQLWTGRGGALAVAVGGVGVAVWKHTANASVALAVVCAALMFLGELLLAEAPKGKVVDGKVRRFRHVAFSNSAQTEAGRQPQSTFRLLQRALPWFLRAYFSLKGSLLGYFK